MTDRIREAIENMCKINDELNAREAPACRWCERLRVAMEAERRACADIADDIAKDHWAADEKELYDVAIVIRNCIMFRWLK